MRVKIKQIADKMAEQVIIECVEVTKDIEQIRTYILTKGKMVTGIAMDKIYQIPLEEIYYFEAVDEQVFAYTKTNVFQIKSRLYELQKIYEKDHFFRCSKSILINLEKLDSISPALNGRFTAHMSNHEKVIISRQYVPELKKIYFGGDTDER